MDIVRYCIVTNKRINRDELLRIVKTPNGEVLIDKFKNIKGRGAYLLPRKEVVELARKKNSLSKALKTKVNDKIYDEILKYL